MIGNFLQKRKEKKQAALVRNEKLKGIDNFPLGIEWDASEKKKEELTQLIEFLISLIDDHNFKVIRSWSTGLPKDCYLRKDYDDAEILIEPYIDVSGQNYDRVGKISIGLNWSYGGVYDEEKDEYSGEVDESKECTLKTLNKILPDIIKNFDAIGNIGN